MTKEQINENNILIADFLNWKKFEKFNYQAPLYRNYLNVAHGISQTNIFHRHSLCFHNNWEWLMLALEHITTIPIGKQLDGRDVFTYPRTFGMRNHITKNYLFRFNGYKLFEEEKLINAAYLAVLEFIDRKNEEK